MSALIPVEPFELVLFGATGDLARRKIWPALWRRWAAGQIRPDSRLIGAARSAHPREAFREEVAGWIAAALGGAVPEGIGAFLERVDYVQLDAKGEAGWDELAARLDGAPVRCFYFSVGPELFAPLAERLSARGLITPESRVVVEKPFGHDLASARELNRALRRCFEERQIFRIDHYLGKETVQNLMAVRFANVLFEPLWNAQFVDHVQITVAEDIGVAGRGAYYDHAGAIRDMVQNHIMQLLCLVAMEPPSRFEADAVRDEKLKVIRALDPVPPEEVVLGQYRAGNGVASYREDVGNSSSRTESFVALKAHVSNWRWAGTPFYIRTGKRLRARLSEIAVIFKDPPHNIFGADHSPRPNVLAIRLQPNEGMDLTVTIKEPGPGGMRLVEVPLDMTFAEAFGADIASMPDAYERLIMDVIRGNQTLFMRGDEVEAAWAWTDPIIAGIAAADLKPEPYDPGSSGPEGALALIHRDGRRWRPIEVEG
ncbi:MAG: glucose-6-phosphate dehydrogenase [Alphaproteobacteria bacterium]|nr:MAG: glucose-6-phosphate dehydrogenase [Alphaproteobacteria bacterium]